MHPSRIWNYRSAPLFLAAPLFVTSLFAQNESPLPKLPPDIPKDAVVRIGFLDKTPTGQDVVWRTPDGTIHEFMQMNDRGRGPKIYSTYRLDSGGLVVDEESKGVDYMKTPVEERFSLVGGTASWKNQSEDAMVRDASGRAYIDLNAGPESGAILARALLATSGHALPVLPSGEARIEKLQSVPVAGARNATLYEVSGLSYTPNYLWLDDNRQFLAVVSGDFSIAQPGFEAAIPTLRESQRQVENARAASLAKTLTHKPSGDLIVTHVTVFDSLKGATNADQRVTVRGNRIVSVEPDREQAITPGAESIDGRNKMLLPGLWDMHEHLFAEAAYLDILTGITTIRDLGNSIDELTKLRGQIDGGTQIGPRVIPAGFIDGPGPFEGPIKVLAATPEEARQRVDHYADLGYVQIKIYSSVKPELVPVIIAEAHKRGLRVSGHVPAGMIAEQFVREGADEIQHMNFIFLNFMPDVKETRTPARFIEPGLRGGDLDLNGQPVKDFLALLKAHHTVVDPTMATWENTYLDRPGEIAKMDALMFDRLPVQVQRSSKSGGGALGASDPATDRKYRAAYANMVRMVKTLYDAGIQLVAGTDDGRGYGLDRELEIYTEAGIPAPEVLRMTTFEAAKVMNMDHDFGSITPGKYADLVLIDGDPTKRIGDLRHVDVVIKNGDIYRPAEMYRAFGIRPK